MTSPFRALAGVLRRAALTLTLGLAAVLGVGLGTGLVATANAAPEYRLRLHHFLPATSHTHVNFLAPWAKAVEADSGGRIVIDIFPAMQLGGKPPQLFDQAKDGIADIVWTLPGYSPGRFPIAEVFELPFMAGSAEATSQAISAFAARHLEEEFGDVHPILFHCHSPGSFHLRGHKVASLEDLANLKIRAPSRTINAALAVLGASPVGMPVPQVPQSLASGVIDGTLLPYEVTLPLKVHELVDHHTEIAGPQGFYTALFVLAMNKDRYTALPDDLKAVIDAHSGLAFAAKVGRSWDEAEQTGRDAAIAEGNTITQIPESALDDWREKTQPVIDDWVARMDAKGLDGAALLAEARALIKQYSMAEEAEE